MSSDGFKSMAAPLMSDTDTHLMEQLFLDPDPVKANDERPSYADNVPSTGCSFIDGWREWERTLRLNLARHRAVKTKRENEAPIEPPLFPADAAAAAIKAAVGTDSPLEGEIIIDKARWNAIEVLAGNDYFDRNTIFAYYLKLVLLERRALKKKKKGFVEYKSLYASILESGQHPVGEPK
jgi:hypothetical protein